MTDKLRKCEVTILGLLRNGKGIVALVHYSHCNKTTTIRLRYRGSVMSYLLRLTVLNRVQHSVI